MGAYWVRNAVTSLRWRKGTAVFQFKHYGRPNNFFFREICVDYRGKHYLWGSKCVQRRRCATLDTVFNVRILSILYLLLCFSREW